MNIQQIQIVDQLLHTFIIKYKNLNKKSETIVKQPIMTKSTKFITLSLLLASLFIIHNTTYYLYSQSQSQQQGLSSISPFNLEAANKQFVQWSLNFARQYRNNDQFNYRLQVFNRNKKLIQDHNMLARQGKHRWFMTANRFADYTEQEYISNYAHSIKLDNVAISANITTKCLGSISDSPNPPDIVNWTQKAVDKNVIDEKKCAANWAFSAVSAVEGLYAIKMEKFVKFSDQQVIDCSGAYGNEGCGGGFMDQAYWYLIDNGMASEKSYPLVQVSQNCRYSQSQKIAKLGKCAKVPVGSYSKLISAVVQQPVTVAVASLKFMLYERGIFDSQCTTDIDRGMLLVGYGTEGQEDYWILKNTLGVAWGQKGFIRIKRTHQDGPGWCGIQLAASVPQNVQ